MIVLIRFCYLIHPYLFMYTEDRLIQLSGIQHIAFCPRQFALAYIEMQWENNALTVEGNYLHKKVDDPMQSDALTPGSSRTGITFGLQAHLWIGKCSALDQRVRLLRQRDHILNGRPLRYHPARSPEDVERCSRMIPKMIQRSCQAELHPKANTSRLGLERMSA